MSRAAQRLAGKVESHRPPRGRARNAQGRVPVAEQRDASAELRDLAAAARDRSADARDTAMADLDSVRPDGGANPLDDTASAAELRSRGVMLRGRAARQRLLAAEDRRAAAHDRELAAIARYHASRERGALAAELDRAAVDGLTGALTRAAGLAELEHECERARRTQSSLVLTWVNVVGLEAVNDALGCPSGDRLLRQVVDGIRAHLRPYDWIVRVSGDEFLCAMPHASVGDAQRRFRMIAAALGRAPEPSAISTSFAELKDASAMGSMYSRLAPPSFPRPH